MKELLSKTCYNSSLKFFTYCKNEFGIEEIEDMMPIYLKQYISIRAFNDAEVAKMIKIWNYKNFYNARNKAIIAMLFETGIRNNELCNLRLLDVRETLIKVLGKGNKERYVPISSALKKILVRY